MELLIEGMWFDHFISICINWQYILLAFKPVPWVSEPWGYWDLFEGRLQLCLFFEVYEYSLLILFYPSNLQNDAASLYFCWLSILSFWAVLILFLDFPANLLACCRQKGLRILIVLSTIFVASTARSSYEADGWNLDSGWPVVNKTCTFFLFSLSKFTACDRLYEYFLIR